MQKILLLAVSDNERTEYISAAVTGKYEIERTGSTESAKKALRERLSEFTAVIVDCPSGITGIEELISELTELNSYMMAVPMLMLTDSTHREEGRFQRGKRGTARECCRDSGRGRAEGVPYRKGDIEIRQGTHRA